MLAFLGNTPERGRIDVEDQAVWLVEELAEDAQALECEAELARALRIVNEGSGADGQVDHYRLRLLDGDDRDQALRSVVDYVVAETRKGSGAHAS